MSQHTPQGNLISNTTRDGIGLLHQTADLFVPPVIDSVFHGAAKGVLDWAGAATNQPATSAPSQLGQQSASWPPAAPSQFAQPSATWPPLFTLVTWMPLVQTTCQPTQQASHDLAALWEIVKALVALNKELASRINLLQESVRQLSPRQYAQANNTSTPNNMQPSLNISITRSWEQHGRVEQRRAWEQLGRHQQGRRQCSIRRENRVWAEPLEHAALKK